MFFFLLPLHQNFLLLEEVGGRSVGSKLAEKQEYCVEVEKLNCYWDKVLKAPNKRLDFTLGLTLSPLKKIIAKLHQYGIIKSIGLNNLKKMNKKVNIFFVFPLCQWENLLYLKSAASLCPSSD